MSRHNNDISVAQLAHAHCIANAVSSSGPRLIALPKLIAKGSSPAATAAAKPPLILGVLSVGIAPKEIRLAGARAKDVAGMRRNGRGPGREEETAGVA